jgi:hypothetical protein
VPFLRHMASALIASWKTKEDTAAEANVSSHSLCGHRSVGISVSIRLGSRDLRISVGKSAEVAEARLINPATSALIWQPSQYRKSC